MKIRTKILALFTLGAVVPLLLSHFFSTQMVSKSIRGRIAENMSRTAELAAGRIGDHVERSIKELTMVVDAIPFENFAPEDLHRALEIPYRQLPGATIITLLNEEGRSIALPFHKAAAEAQLLNREAVTEDDLRVFSQNVPLKLSLTAEIALGPAYLSSGGIPRMVMARSYSIPEEETSWVLAVEFSLADICNLVNAHNISKTSSAALVDMRGRVICTSAGQSTPLELYYDVERLDAMADSVVKSYTDNHGDPVLGVSDGVAIAGWRLVIEQPETMAMEPLKRSLYWTGMWVVVSLVVALAGGAILSRELTSPLAALEQAATRIAEGDYERTLEVSSRDEVGQLAGAFNHMTAEIRTWNTELMTRVEERTKALREAREQIIQTQKLAAIGELGSGVAHEINNPLTGVIGVAQLLRSEPDCNPELARGLDEIIASARRVADVVDVLLRFSQSQVSPEMHAVEVGKVARAAVDLFAARLEERQIQVATHIEGDCRIFARESDIKLSLNHLIDNAVRAMPDGGRMTIEVKRVEGGAVLISVIDSGIGMTEDVRTRAFDPFFTSRAPGSSARGLGLSVVHQVVTEHDGRIVLESEPNKGTKINIYLPGAARLSRD